MLINMYVLVYTTQYYCYWYSDLAQLRNQFIITIVFSVETYRAIMKHSSSDYLCFITHVMDIDMITFKGTIFFNSPTLLFFTLGWSVTLEAL